MPTKSEATKEMRSIRFVETLFRGLGAGVLGIAAVGLSFTTGNVIREGSDSISQSEFMVDIGTVAFGAFMLSLAGAESRKADLIQAELVHFEGIQPDPPATATGHEA